MQTCQQSYVALSMEFAEGSRRTIATCQGQQPHCRAVRHRADRYGRHPRNSPALVRSFLRCLFLSCGCMGRYQSREGPRNSLRFGFGRNRRKSVKPYRYTRVNREFLPRSIRLPCFPADSSDCSKPVVTGLDSSPACRVASSYRSTASTGCRRLFVCPGLGMFRVHRSASIPAAVAALIARAWPTGRHRIVALMRRSGLLLRG